MYVPQSYKTGKCGCLAGLHSCPLLNIVEFQATKYKSVDLIFVNTFRSKDGQRKNPCEVSARVRHFIKKRKLTHEINQNNCFTRHIGCACCAVCQIWLALDKNTGLKGVDMKVLKQIGKICFILLVVVALIMDGLFIYYHFFNKDTTTGVNYIDNQVGLDVEAVLKADDLTQEEKDALQDRYFLEANYYSNSKNNGIELQELKMNYFMDYTLTSNVYRSSGMQFVGNYEGTLFSTWDGLVEQHYIPLSDDYYGTDEESVKIANEYVDTSFTYYDYTNGVNWSGVTNNNGSIATKLTRTTEFVIKIDNRAFAIKLDKYTDEYVGAMKVFWGLGWKMHSAYNRYYYTYGSLFQSCMQAIKSNSKGYGDYYIVVDLSSMFSVKEYDLESKKYVTDDVTDIIKNYSVLKFHYDENGARNSSQSMFGSINMDSRYDIEENKWDTQYWQERFVYNLTEKDLNFRYSEVYGGHLATLSAATKNKFDNMDRAKVNISINLDSQYLEENEINLIGIDYKAFEDFEIDTLSITGTCDNFLLLEQCLNNSDIKTLKHSKTVVLNIKEGATNNEYVEVVI